MFKSVQNENGTWKKVPLDIAELEAEYQKAYDLCIANRQAEYPKVADYLDAQAKGDTVAMQAWNDKQLAVKAKYQKPNRADYGLV